jgi:hypothetical protein
MAGAYGDWTARLCLILRLDLARFRTTRRQKDFRLPTAPQQKAPNRPVFITRFRRNVSLKLAFTQVLIAMPQRRLARLLYGMVSVGGSKSYVL